MGSAKKLETKKKPAPKVSADARREAAREHAEQLAEQARKELKRSGGKLFTEDDIEEYLGR